MRYDERVEAMCKAVSEEMTAAAQDVCDGCFTPQACRKQGPTWPAPCVLPDQDEVMKAKVVLDQMYGYWGRK